MRTINWFFENKGDNGGPWVDWDLNTSVRTTVYVRSTGLVQYAYMCLHMHTVCACVRGPCEQVGASVRTLAACECCFTVEVLASARPLATTLAPFTAGRAHVSPQHVSHHKRSAASAACSVPSHVYDSSWGRTVVHARTSCSSICRCH